ncbi:MAG: type I restriction endonuclease, partial [Candidatus Geothermarchaeales archaeon]
MRTIPAILEGIRRFLDILRNGLVVPSQREAEEKVIRLVDLENVENNEFMATNQFRVEGLNEEFKLARGSMGSPFYGGNRYPYVPSTLTLLSL